MKRRRWRVVGAFLGVAAATIACGRANDSAKLNELQRVRSGTLDIVLLSPRDGLRHGKDTFMVEFRSTSSGSLIDVGQVRGTATMPMPGMPMFGTIGIEKTDVGGRYAANAELAMAGTWRMAVQWDGSAGQGSVTFSGTVQ